MGPGQTPFCVFHEPCEGGSALVHGDGFVGVISRHRAERVVGHLKNTWEVNVTVLGPGKDDAKNVRTLNRVIT